MATVERKDLERALSDVDYPADKDQLLDRAGALGGTEDVMRAVRSLPQEEYRNFGEVLASVHPDVQG